MRLADVRAAPSIGTKLMIVARWFGCALAAAFLVATAGQAAELPAQRQEADQGRARQDMRHRRQSGVLAANGVCVRLSGYISSQFSGGNLHEQYK